MPFGLRQRGEAAQGVSPQLHHRILELRLSAPVRERLRAFKAYDSRFTRLFSRRFNETPTREPGQDEMRSTPGTTTEDNSEADSTSNSSPLQGRPDTTADVKPPEPNAPIEPINVHLADSPSLGNRPNQGLDVLSPSRNASSSSSGTARSMSSVAMVPVAIKRLSRSNGVRLKKRFSNGSTIRTSYTPSVFDNDRANSITSTAASTNAWLEESTILATSEQRGSVSKRLKLSPASSHSDLGSFDGEGVFSQRQSFEGSLSSVTDSGLLREAISPSPYEHPTATKSCRENPEIRVQTGCGWGLSITGPELVESQMKDLEIDDRSPQNSGKALSIISEGCSDAGNSAPDTHATPGRSDHPALLVIPPSPNTPELPSDSSFVTENDYSNMSSLVPVDSTQATSIDGGDSDNDHDERSLSDFSDEADEPFLEAFNATSLHPGMLPQVLMIRRQIMSIVESHIIEWMTSCPSDGSPQSHGGQSSSSNLGMGTSTSASQSGRGTKRYHDDDEAKDPDGGDGDDDPKRRKTAGQAETWLPREIPLVCPFAKRYPEKDWPPLCEKGFLKVARLKEHIYRKHMLRPHCKRCFHEFETESEVENHAQEEIPCKRIPRPDWMIGRINEDVKCRIRSRKGIQNQSERSKWNGVYEILFPGEKVPSPYVDIDPMARQRSLDELFEFQQRSGRMIKEKLQREPNLPAEMTQLLLRTVNDVFASLTPGSTPSRDEDLIEIASGTLLAEEDQPTSHLGAQFPQPPMLADPPNLGPLDGEISSSSALLGDFEFVDFDSFLRDCDAGMDMRHGNDGNEEYEGNDGTADFHWPNDTRRDGAH